MDNYIFGKNSVEFVTVGVEFCAFMERTTEMTQEEFTSTCVKLLPLLYLKGTLLPEGEEDSEYFDTPEQFVTEEYYEFLRRNIEHILGDKDAYLQVQSSDMQYSDLPIAASVAEDLADLYQVIKDCVSAYRTENEECMRAALTICREDFKTYWGAKLLSALGPLHRICFDTESDDIYECECGHHHHHTHDEENFYQHRQSDWYADEEDADRWL
ncbi:MAG: DUF5063 domain-containing protein [Coprobacter sp.]|nr:DUF5063 domain-containing protein [Coprobacter sp.]